MYSLEEYQRDAARTIANPDNLTATLRHALYGIGAESGEIMGLYQKIYQGHELDPEHVKKEVGDLLWMIAELCTANSWSLAQIARMNIEKLRRRYPDGFSPERSLHREQGDV